MGPGIERDFGFTPDFENAKLELEKGDGAGNTFKATAKPVLIGTAVVGATVYAIADGKERVAPRLSPSGVQAAFKAADSLDAYLYLKAHALLP